jgi:hypothetical protein
VAGRWLGGVAVQSFRIVLAWSTGAFRCDVGAAAATGRDFGDDLFKVIQLILPYLPSAWVVLRFANDALYLVVSMSLLQGGALAADLGRAWPTLLSRCGDNRHHCADCGLCRK